MTQDIDNSLACIKLIRVCIENGWTLDIWDHTEQELNYTGVDFEAACSFLVNTEDSCNLKVYDQSSNYLGMAQICYPGNDGTTGQLSSIYEYDNMGTPFVNPFIDLCMELEYMP